MENHWYKKQIYEVFEILNTNEHGLSIKEAERRLKVFGSNKLPEGKSDGFVSIFLRQFQSPLIYVLLISGTILFFLGEAIDGYVIFFVLIFNSVVGALQENKAQNTLLALKKFTDTNATTIRGQKEFIVRDYEVVPGDIIILQEGEKIPADARIIAENNLKIDESALTGESTPVHKVENVIEKPELPTAEQKNMVFKGTNVLSGNGKAVVVVTGIKTIIGKISKEVAAIDKDIPLKENIRYLSRLIVIAVVSVSGLLFLFGVFSGRSIKEMFAMAVALSVAIIPEGLPIVITLVLATGVWRMAKQNVLVKRLQAVEALGQARIIAVDKTGTITKNEMVVKKVFVDGNLFEIGGVGYDPKGSVKLMGRIIDPVNHQELLSIGKAATFSANARLMFSEGEDRWRVTGDPTEAAILVLSQKLGFHKYDLERESPLIDEMPFDYKLKYHATLHKVDNKKLMSVAGAPEVILSLSNKIWHAGKTRPLSEDKRKELESIIMQMSKEGLRIVALAEASKTSKKLSPKEVNSLAFIGFLGIKDALRPEALDAIKNSMKAGIKFIMITGDHAVTAVAIAKEIGIYSDGDKILTGQEIDKFSDKELSKNIIKVSIFARVTPEHKIRIIKAYKKSGQIVAMTGDGVNDAPSLVAADLGIAMGKIGTEVAKEASDIVLMDDNLGNIVLAIEEGRNIYKTIKKVILYLFSTSVGEALTITGALLLTFPLPILPAQIIWLNFVTDSFLDVSLAMEPKEKGLFSKYFEKPKKYLVDKLMVLRIFIMSLPMMAGVLFLFSKYFEHDIAKAWTISLTTLAVFQWFNVWNCRSEDKSIFQMSFSSNKFLVGATVIVVSLQLLAVYNPVLQKILHTVPLSFSEWLIILPIASSIIVVEEIRKYFYRKNLKS